MQGYFNPQGAIPLADHDVLYPFEQKVKTMDGLLKGSSPRHRRITHWHTRIVVPKRHRGCLERERTHMFRALWPFLLNMNTPVIGLVRLLRFLPLAL